MKLKNILKLLVFLIFIGVAFCCVCLFVWKMDIEKFLKTTDLNVEITINKGDNANKVYREIFNGVETPYKFKTYLYKFKQFDMKIKYGFYSSAGLTVSEFLDNIQTGKETAIKVTVPEGYNIYELASAMARMGVTEKEKIIAAAFDPSMVATIIGENYSSLEGFLFPGTYLLPKNSSPELIFRTMYGEFKKNLPADFNEKAKSLGLTFYEALTLASIIQKETYLETEAPIVSSVFLNRLKRRMRLQADPTIIYGMYPEFDGNIRKKNLNDGKNIYNTYRRGGLTPTPICNPSLMAITAAVNPADTKYLYFVAGKTGVHYFSETYEQHDKYLRQYLLQ